MLVRHGHGAITTTGTDMAMIFDIEQLGKIFAQRHESLDVDNLIAQRDRFLRDHPELVSYQKEIDSILSTTLDPVRRIEILFMLISERLTALRDAMGDLTCLTKSLVRSVKAQDIP